jgi:hypothetical protein
MDTVKFLFREFGTTLKSLIGIKSSKRDSIKVAMGTIDIFKDLFYD